jgi:hypothetical protein
MRRLLIFVLTALLALGTFGVTASPATAAPADDENTFLSLLNQTRQANGRAPVVLDPGLSGDARVWSGVMAQKNLLHHTDSTRMVNEVKRVVPDWTRLGENVGVGYGVQSLHDAFWNSSGHRANMLGDYNRVGVGVVHSGGKIWVTFRFVKGSPISGQTGGCSTTAGFSDVCASAYFADAVAWLSRTGVTTGIGGTNQFQPHGTVTRAQMATFLHRLAGEPRATARRFSEAPSGASYASAVDWLRATGLTTGVGGTNNFNPNGGVTRDQMAAFLHRFAGEMAMSGRHGFVDVPRTSFADSAVTWLAQHGITTGIAGTNRFDPGGTVTRGQMATFLHRLNGSRDALASGAQPIRV